MAEEIPGSVTGTLSKDSLQSMAPLTQSLQSATVKLRTHLTQISRITLRVHKIKRKPF